jgi:signal transduction histidine kinase
MLDGSYFISLWRKPNFSMPYFTKYRYSVGVALSNHRAPHNLHSMTRIKISDRMGATIRVLAVEDNPGDLRLVKEFLGEGVLGKYQMNSAVTLSVAMELLGSGAYDVVLLDLNLPDSQGLDTFTKLHVKFPGVPIVVLTGSQDDRAATRAINEGAQDYLYKDEITSCSLSRSVIYAIERKKIELELMEEKGRAELYLDLLTHDINNYITAAMGYLQLAEMRLNIEEKDKKMINIPIQQLRNSSELIANVRSMQRLEVDRNKGEPVDVVHMLEVIIGEYEHPPGRDVAIVLTERGDRTYQVSSFLRDAFSNIVSNAIKHSSGPVQIEIALRSAERDGKQFVQVSLDDNGPGIPNELKDRVFERSIRGATKVTGQGLGLYLVRRLVEDQGGKVWVEDRVPGDRAQGARFVVQLPAVEAKDAAPVDIAPTGA